MVSQSSSYLIGAPSQEPVSSSSSTPGYMGTTHVVAEVVEVFKGWGRVGDEIVLSSSNYDSMCGVGEQLQSLGMDWIIETNDLKETTLSMCRFNFPSGYRTSMYEDVEKVLRKHDCSCKVEDCRLREGRRVLKGPCRSTKALCARNEKTNQCQWLNTTIASCKSGYRHGF